LHSNHISPNLPAQKFGKLTFLGLHKNMFCFKESHSFFVFNFLKRFFVGVFFYRTRKSTLLFMSQQNKKMGKMFTVDDRARLAGGGPILVWYYKFNVEV